MRPPRTLNVIDQHGGFTIETKDGDTLWRPAPVLRDGTTWGTLIDFDESKFCQTNNNVTRARYRVPHYGYKVVIWFNNETEERIA